MPERFSMTVPIDRWDPRRGGAERYIDRLCRDLVARGHGVTILCLRTTYDHVPGGPTIERLGVPWWPRWRRELEFARRTVAAHRASGRDLLFAVRHALEADVYQPHGGSYRAARRGSAQHLPPWRRTLRSAVAAVRPTVHVLRWLDRAVFERSPGVRVLSISRKIEDEFRSVYPDLEFAFERLYHGVDLKAFDDPDRTECAAELRARFGIAPEARVALFLAHRFAPKGLAHAVRAVARCARWHLVVGGRDRPGPWRALAARAGAPARVHFAGVVSDSRRALAGADAFVLPTYYDACSLAVLEALACGTPVVTTPASGSGELLESGVEGVLIDSPRDEAAFAAALHRIDADWDRFHAAARALRESLSWERHVDRLEAILSELAAEKRS